MVGIVEWEVVEGVIVKGEQEQEQNEEEEENKAIVSQFEGNYAHSQIH